MSVSGEDTSAVREQTGAAKLLARSVSRSADEEEGGRAIVKAVRDKQPEKAGESEESPALQQLIE